MATFEDSAVKDRTPRDHAGEWRSYTLIWRMVPWTKSLTTKLTGKMTAAEYKDYYAKGYKNRCSPISHTDKNYGICRWKIQEIYYKYVGYTT